MCCTLWPQNLEELDQWAEEIVTEYKGHDVCLPPWLAVVKRLVVTSKWSGCGGMNIAVMKIIKAIEEIMASRLWSCATVLVTMTEFVRAC